MRRKFRLCDELKAKTGTSFIYEIEERTDLSDLVTIWWEEDGEDHCNNYQVSAVKKFFNNGDWIEVGTSYLGRCACGELDKDCRDCNN
jgi:hypothetical protein